MTKNFSIAIDGPAGAGKTTQAKALAKALGFVYVDTGAMYRALAVYMQGEELEDVPEILPEVNLQAAWDEEGNQRMSINGVDVTDLLRTPEISRLASDISAIPEVRDFLLETQREIARENNVVMEGRDIGTVILPDATLKIFLTASLDERAWRRSRQLEPGTYLLSFVKKISRDGTGTTAPGMPPRLCRRRTPSWWTAPAWTSRRQPRLFCGFGARPWPGRRINYVGHLLSPGTQTVYFFCQTRNPPAHGEPGDFF